MDFLDILVNKIDAEAELKKPVNALICFSRPETGNALCSLAVDIARAKSEKSSITVLHFISEEEMQTIEDMNIYKSSLFSRMIEKTEKNHITIRTFVETSNDYVTDILDFAEKYESNLILLGIGKQVFNPMLWSKYLSLKRDSLSGGEQQMERHFNENEVRSLTSVATLLNRSPRATGVFVMNDFSETRKIFVPILDKEDIHLFTYIYQIAQKENVKVMVWDAIGIIESHPKMQKLYQFMQKKTDGRIYIWDNNKKIEHDFIQQQDLVVVGIEGWDKLISSALQWTDSLPSTLIIKDKSN